MTPAAHHPALVAAVEALENIIRGAPATEYGTIVNGEDANRIHARAALALLRAAMEKAETWWMDDRGTEEHAATLCRPKTLHTDKRVTVLRWEE